MTKATPILVIILSFILAFFAFPYMPQNFATHWGVNNEVDGYSSKVFGLFFLPTLLIVFYFIFSFLPKTDPYKHNFNQFKKYYDNFVSLIFLFLFYIYSLTLVWNFGIKFNFIQFMAPAFSAIFFYAGVLMKNAKRNWFVGIRTPWTLSSDTVWHQTHQAGSLLFKLVSLSCLLIILWPNLMLQLFMFPLFFVIVFLFVYSYFLYRQENA